MTIFKKLRQLFRRIFAPKTVRLDGILLMTDRTLIASDIRKAIYRDRYELAERRLVKTALSPGDRVLEIGAGIGLISMLCARIVGQENVLSFEPNPTAIEMIKRNYSLNGIIPQLRGRAVTTDGAEVAFHISSKLLSSSLFARENIDAKAAVVESESLASLIENYRPTAIVMDAEGAEVDLLTETTLAGVDKIIVELHPHIVGAHRIQLLSDHLQAVGFREVQQIGKTVYFCRR